MSHLPKNWEEILSSLAPPVTMVVVGRALDIHPDRLWVIRKGDKAFDDAIVSLVKQSKHIYDGSRIPQKSTRARKVVKDPHRKERTIKDRLGQDLPLIDEENLEQEVRLACLVIASLTSHDLHEISLNEIRRWGALLAMSHDQIHEKRKKNVDFEREVRLLREQMHRILTARSSRPHASGSGVADVA